MADDRDRWVQLVLGGDDPWVGHELPTAPPDLQGWGSEHPVHEQLVRLANPRRILEIGSWKGASAVHLARLAGPACSVLCVDTWLGSGEMFGVPSGDPQRGLRRYRGYPRVYDVFLANVAGCGVHQQVCPFPAPSALALRWLRDRGERFDLIYVDGSHDYDDVMDDLLGAWPLLASGGVLYGDDWSADWPGVGRAVERFQGDGRGAGPLVRRRDQFWWFDPWVSD
jgi:SAM-dependent methyltransferase